MGKFASCNMNRHTANAGENAEVINAHSEVIEALVERMEQVESLISGHVAGHILWADRGNLADVVGELPEAVRLRCDAAADTILAQRDKLMSILRDEGMRVWTQALTSIFVAALRDAGRDADDADE